MHGGVRLRSNNAFNTDLAEVYVLPRDPGRPAPLSADELAELEAGLAEADRGETISCEQFFEQLRRHE